MGLKKGQTNNPNGRKKGVPNKSTQSIKEFITPIVTGQLDKITEDDWEKLRKKSFKDFVDALSKLLPYVAAKHIDIKGEVDNKLNIAVKRTIIKKNGSKS
jgi:hypothetical protein